MFIVFKLEQLGTDVLLKVKNDYYCVTIKYGDVYFGRTHHIFYFIPT